MSENPHPSEAATMNHQAQSRKSEVGSRKCKKFLLPTSDFRLQTSSRPAFTLIELIVVIGVIALLASTSLLVMGNVLQSAREKATMATITKVNGMLQQRAEALQRYLEKPANLATEKEQTRQFLIRANAAYNGYPPVPPWTIDNASDRVWETLTRARKTREAFPQAFVDICGPDREPGTRATDDTGSLFAGPFLTNGFPDIGELGVAPAGQAHGDVLAFVKAIQTLKAQIVGTKHTPETESAELLYLTLTAAEAFGVPPVGQDEFSTSEVKDTDGDGLMEFVDAWGRPLRFYRAPTRLLRCGEDLNANGSLDNEDGNSNGVLDAGEDNGPGYYSNNGNLDVEDVLNGIYKKNNALDPAGPTCGPVTDYARLMISALPSLKSGDATLQRDPNDAFGLIYKYVIRANDNSGNPPTQALEFDRRRFYEYWFYTPDTYSSMLVVSAGPDGILGLDEPGSTPTGAPTAATRMGHLAQPTALGDPSASPLADNVTNRRQ
ncbi:MAG: type II secretion system protein [Planctomycetaceae bacterium]|nr:type II secretion system protein [Planctomycetaceae bacterium]